MGAVRGRFFPRTLMGKCREYLSSLGFPLKKEREGAENITKQFALDEQEIEDIYDLFEEEMDI